MNIENMNICTYKQIVILFDLSLKDRQIDLKQISKTIIVKIVRNKLYGKLSSFSFNNGVFKPT